MPLINHYSYTSPGPRTSNQDAILVEQLPLKGFLCCVADGVGGNQGGETASNLAIQVIAETMRNNNGSTLSDAIKFAHEKILIAGAADNFLSGMATTITTVLLQDGKLHGANCGDSRTYLLRGNGIKQLSYDHSEVARLLRSGKLTKEAAVDYPRKNILDSALGAKKELQIHEFEIDAQLGDRVVLLSDGVSSVVSKKDFRDLSKEHSSVNAYGECLMDLVEKRETKDNYSIIILEVQI